MNAHETEPGGTAGLTPTLFTAPQTADQLEILARAVINGDLPNPDGGAPSPLELAKITLLLPSRRACRAMHDIFLSQGAGRAMLLPRIHPIGDVDQYLALMQPGEGGRELLPVIPDLERRLVLTDLVRKWAKTMQKNTAKDEDGLGQVFPAATPAQASALAADLMRLMDEIEIEGANLDGLHELVAEQFSDHWKLTLDFLKIVTDFWPVYLDEKKMMSPQSRRDALIRGQAQRLAMRGGNDPVILAGEVGGIAATAELMRVVANLPNGAVLLPGLDLHLDEDSWNEIVPGHPEHPQYGLKQFLDSLELARGAVQILPGCQMDTSTDIRLRLISEIMRPAETTYKWSDYARHVDTKALEGVLQNMSVISAPTAQDEAEVIAYILRHAVETPGQTAALVTPDRRLARRVTARLNKWRLPVDDSGGEPLAKTQVGAFFDLVIEVVNGGFEPATLMSLLKHPMVQLGGEPGAVRRAARHLELLALRQPRIEEGLFAIRRNLERSIHKIENKHEYHPVLSRLKEKHFVEVKQLLDQVEEVFKPLSKAFKSRKSIPLKAVMELHRQTGEKLGMDTEGNCAHLWARQSGEAMGRFFETLGETSFPLGISAREYAGFYRGLVNEQTSRSPVSHPRLFVWGPMEARLLRADIIVLGALNEGTWPQQVDADAWLSRPMREQVGLSAPERKIGRAAHDVAQAMGAARVYLTRAAKIDGVPTVPSRWLLRLQTLVEGTGLSGALDEHRDRPWLAWARTRDVAMERAPITRPEPCPPVAARPRKLPVTQVENWIANPYAIYARSILKLQPLPDLGREPDAQLRGQIIHKALHQFSEKFNASLPDEISHELVALGEKLMREYGKHPRVMAFWVPRFQRFAAWFAQSEPTRRENLTRHLAEVDGQVGVSGPAGEFTLTARADRIDLQSNGDLTIYDYKTGYVPSASEVEKLMRPQLPLEAAIARHGGFEGLASGNVSKLRYIEVKGGEPPGKEHDGVRKTPVHNLAGDALEGLKRLVEQYDNELVAYPALRRPQFQDHYRFDDYEHLARVKEWALELGDEGGSA